MTKKNVSRKNAGFTLIGALASIVIGTVVFFGSMRGLQFVASSSATTKRVLQLNEEHSSLVSIVQSIPRSVAQRVFCRHPYYRYNIAAEECVPGLDPAGDPYPDPSVAEVAALDALADKVFEWGGVNTLVSGVYNPELDLGFYNSEIVPAMAAAGCIVCHDGSLGGAINPVLGLNFSIYGDITGGIRPLATRAILASPLGQKLLKPSMPVPGLMSSAQRVGHTVEVLLNASGVQCAPSNAAPRNYTSNNSADAACPGTCLGGAFPDQAPNACNADCTTTTAPSCGTGFECTQWTTDTNCLTPTVRCADPPTCPVGEAVTSCIENQNGSPCGNGATVWTCGSGTGSGALTYRVTSVVNTSPPSSPKISVKKEVSTGAFR